jgi:AmmeMemoRadiSam system protein A
MMLVFAGLSPHPPLIIPTIGGAELKRVDRTVIGMRLLGEKAAATNPETMIFISPHGSSFRGAMGYLGGRELTGSFAEFGAPKISFRVDNDLDLAQGIAAEAEKAGIEVIEVVRSSQDHSQQRGLDHGVMVPLYYLREAGVETPLVAFGISMLPLPDLYRFGVALGHALTKSAKRVALIASGDLSHRLIPDAPAGYSPEGKVFDQVIRESLEQMDTDRILNLSEDLVELAGECGLRPIVMLMGALQDYEVKTRILSYEGPFGVGYLVAEFEVNKKPVVKTKKESTANKRKHSLDTMEGGPLPVQLARASVAHYLRNKKLLPVPSPIPEGMDRPSGVFVSLHKNGQLRGCIGTIEPTQPNIASEIIHNAVSAALRDPRFLPVQLGELLNLEISVDVLSKPETISSTEELNPQKYGVIVSHSGHTGLLLPHLDGVNTVEQQVDIARQKAGIAVDEPVEMERFQVIRYE